MPSTAGRGPKTETCDVDGCSNESVRSLSRKQVAKSDLKLRAGEHRSAHLCKEHYREYKKQTRSSREIDQIYRARCWISSS